MIVVEPSASDAATASERVSPSRRRTARERDRGPAPLSPSASRDAGRHEPQEDQEVEPTALPVPERRGGTEPEQQRPDQRASRDPGSAARRTKASAVQQKINSSRQCWSARPRMV
jgi:hypothetical protein